MKTLVTDLGKILVNHIFNKEPISKIHKILLQINKTTQ